MQPRGHAQLLTHMDDVRSWCLMRSGDPHLADDVMQETALAALRNMGALREPERMRGWLFRIAQRRLADAARRRRVERPLTMEPEAPPAEPPPPSERVERLRRVLRGLPEALRRPVRLYYLQGRPLQEVAMSLHTTVDGVKARLYRARKLLRRANL